MIIVSSLDGKLAQRLVQALEPSYPVLGNGILDRRTLEIALRKSTIQVLILHLPVLGQDAMHEIGTIHELQPDTKIIVLTPDFNPREEITAVMFGAKAYLADTLSNELLIKVMTAVCSGEIWVDRKFVTRLLDEIETPNRAHHHEALDFEKGIASLTPREKQIAELISLGSSNRRIAEKLSISERTVKAHLGVIFKKIGIKDRLQLALYINKYHQIAATWPLKPSS